MSAPADAGDAALADALAAELGGAGLTSDPHERDAFSADVYDRGARCALIARPRDVEQLRAVVRIAGAAGYALIPRGGGLSYTGGYTPPHTRSVLVDLTGLDRIVHIDAESMYLVAEAGVTWKQIDAVLRPQGLRLPCFGTLSGARATVGGGLSNGALFFGSARYGTVADSLLGLEVVLADGTLLHTGQTAMERASRPFYRTFGPDLTSLFVHDCGALGIKARASFRLIRAPERTGYVSFAFADATAAAAALAQIARSGAAEEVYGLDPATTRRNLENMGVRAGVRTLTGVVRNEPGRWRGVKAGARLVRGARALPAGNSFSLHVVCAARSDAALEADLRLCRTLAGRAGGSEIADAIPRAVRAEPFPPLNAVLGPRGERWAALNAKVAHADAAALMQALRELLAPYEQRMVECRVSVTWLLTAISNHAFSLEPVFHWHDEWLPLHRRAPQPAHLGKLTEPPADREARTLVAELRSRVVGLFRESGAASNQIGRTYPWFRSLRPENAALFAQLKRMLDPAGLMNPGVLGLD